MIDKLKNINGHGWVCIAVSVVLALIDALGKFGEIDIQIPAALVTAVTVYATSKKTTKK